MDLFERQSHSFIVKIWREAAARDGRPAIWRGHITHVPGGERRYVRTLDDVGAFIALYLEDIGARLGPLWRLRRWLAGRGARDGHERKS